jgi:hypothetical protein
MSSPDGSTERWVEMSIPSSVTPGERQNAEALESQREWARLAESSGWVQQARKHRERFSEGYLPQQAKVSTSGGMTKVMATRSQWAQGVLQLLGDPYRLNTLKGDEAKLAAQEAVDLREIDPERSRQIVEDLRRFADQERRDYAYPILDTAAKRVLLKCGRQVEKSTMCSVLAVIEPIVHDFFRTLYVSPSSQQTRTFSNEKLKPLIQYSKMVQRYWRNSSCKDQVFEQSFINGAFVFLRYCFLSADRARGIPADRLIIDEIQDVLSSNIRIIEECLSHSKHAYSLYCGTPKSLENTIEVYWGYSTQSEWMVPCNRCSAGAKRYWNMLDIDCIGDEGPICKKCGRAINPSEGVWVDGQPGAPYRGFHISQLMAPWKFADPEKWKAEVVWKLENYEEAEFHNEVLGNSFDNASKPLTRQELVRCCWPQIQPPNIDLSNMIRDPKMQPSVLRSNLYMGVDWGEGREGKTPSGRAKKPSYTVVSIGYFWRDSLVIIYQRRYKGAEADPAYVFDDVVKTAKRFGVICIGLDRGHGWRINGEVFRAFDNTNVQVMQFQYVGDSKETAKWDPLSYTFVLHRTFQMSELINDIKHQRVVFPAWEHTKDIMIDAEHLYADYRRSSQGKDELYYDHTGPDDAFHSVNYVRMAGLVHHQRLLPRAGGESQNP